MKILSKFGFSLTEVVVGVFILSICGVGIVGSYTFLLDRNDQIDNILTNTYFNKYVYDVLNIIDIPDVNIGNKFYLVANGNSFSVSLDPSFNKNNVGFFYPDEIGNYSNEIELISINNLKGINFNTYKIKTIYNQNEKISYIIK
ncbi:MAG: hypothetical protein PHE25_01250 [Candidatus Gracilibacteria bacterium]|nr:hypothetical protein [Candidatus Gracilibacteria bacterium]